VLIKFSLLGSLCGGIEVLMYSVLIVQPRRDNLGLIAPAYVTSLTFLSNEDHRKLVVGTGHHQVRLYDVGGQRRPVLAFNFGESPIRALAADADGYSVYVGTGAGDLACFDMRTGNLCLDCSICHRTVEANHARLQ
jgi:ribosome biogenesis protein NSA1